MWEAATEAAASHFTCRRGSCRLITVAQSPARKAEHPHATRINIEATALSRNAAYEICYHSLVAYFIAAGLQAETIPVWWGHSRLLLCCLLGAPPKRGHASNMQCQCCRLHGLHSQKLSSCNGRTRQANLACWARERHACRHAGGPQVCGQCERPSRCRELKLQESAYTLTEGGDRPLSERHRRSKPSHKDRPVLSMLVVQHPRPYAVLPPGKKGTRNTWHNLFSALPMFAINIPQGRA